MADKKVADAAECLCILSLPRGNDHFTPGRGGGEAKLNGLWTL